MRKQMQESLGLMREIYRAYKAEMATVASYTYGQILFEKTYPTLSDLFSSIAHAEMRHYHALGEILRDLGVSHALRTNLQDFSYRLGGNSDESALLAAQHYLRERLRDEHAAAAHYHSLSEAVHHELLRRKLCALADEEAEHAAALESALVRLSAS